MLAVFAPNMGAATVKFPKNSDALLTTKISIIKI